jgi:hypothetical protein
MNCKWAEGHISACLDGTLDPAVRDEVVTHVDSCTECSSVLADYRRFDRLVGDLPRYEPADDLRARIFESSEFAAIVQSLDEQGAVGMRSAIVSHPVTHPRPMLDEWARRTGHDRPLTALPVSSSASAGVPAEPASATDGQFAVRRARSGAPPWTRVALPAAAVLVLAFGSALLIKQGFLHSRTAGRPTISQVGQPGDAGPLAAGARVVYARNGALWSAPEHGPGLTQQLTPAGVVVGPGWAVAPLRNDSGGTHVAYIDVKTGRVHIVRSDDQRDRIVGGAVAPAAMVTPAFWSSAEGQTILAGLAWSPDGAQLAYLADADGTGHTTVTVVHVDGTAAASIDAVADASSAMPAWSPDSQRIAFVQTSASGQTIWDYNVGTQQVRLLSTTAEPGGSSSAIVRALGWLPATAGPAVTWASGSPATDTYTGVFVRGVLENGAAQRLTANGASFAVAAYSAAQNDGTWLLGDDTGLVAIAAPSGMVEHLAVTGGVQAVTWAPDGSAAAVITGAGELRVWRRTAGLAPVATGVTAQPAPAWSPDATQLAFLAGEQVWLVRVTAGVAGAPRTLAGSSDATAFAWAPDSQRLALALAGGVTIMDADGAVASQVDTHPTASGLVWSMAR